MLEITITLEIQNITKHEDVASTTSCHMKTKRTAPATHLCSSEKARAALAHEDRT